MERLFLPGVPVFFVMMILGMLADGNMALRKDGSMGFTRGLEKRFLELGGGISYKSTVAKIVVDNDAAVGVRLKNGRVHRADKVVSSGDGASTLFDLLGGKFVTPVFKKIHSDFKIFDPVVMVNYGLDGEMKDEPWFVCFKPSKPPQAGHLIDSWLPVRIFNHSDCFAPRGKTLIQVMVESSWRPWAELRHDRPAYKAEKEALSEQVLERLEESWPGLGRRVEMTDVATPHTMWRYTLNREGAYEGFAVTAQSVKTQIKRTLPGLRNFVMAGQWTVPGGGVVPSLMTGRHAVMILCREDGKSFKGE